MIGSEPEISQMRHGYESGGSISSQNDQSSSLIASVGRGLHDNVLTCFKTWKDALKYAFKAIFCVC